MQLIYRLDLARHRHCQLAHLLQHVFILSSLFFLRRHFLDLILGWFHWIKSCEQVLLLKKLPLRSCLAILHVVFFGHILEVSTLVECELHLTDNIFQALEGGHLIILHLLVLVEHLLQGVSLIEVLEYQKQALDLLVHEI